MIEGYFRSGRPYIDISVSMPNLGMVEMDISFAVDTGADRTLIGNRDALLLSASHGIDLSRLPAGRRSLGIGGLTSTRQTRVSMSIGSLHIDSDIPIIEPIPGRTVGLPARARHPLPLRPPHGGTHQSRPASRTHRGRQPPSRLVIPRPASEQVRRVSLRHRQSFSFVPPPERRVRLR